jgi:hypothetical protein
MTGRTPSRMSMGVIAALFGLAFAGLVRVDHPWDPPGRGRYPRGRWRAKPKRALPKRLVAGARWLRARSPWPGGDNSDAYPRKIISGAPRRGSNKRKNAVERAACAAAVRRAHARCHLGRRGVR